jgi:hypothetical protein
MRHRCASADFAARDIPLAAGRVPFDLRVRLHPSHCPVPTGQLLETRGKLQKTATPDAPPMLAAALRRSLWCQAIRSHRLHSREPDSRLQWFLDGAKLQNPSAIGPRPIRPAAHCSLQQRSNAPKKCKNVQHPMPNPARPPRSADQYRVKRSDIARSPFADQPARCTRISAVQGSRTTPPRRSYSTFGRSGENAETWSRAGNRKRYGCGRRSPIRWEIISYAHASVVVSVARRLQQALVADGISGLAARLGMPSASLSFPPPAPGHVVVIARIHTVASKLTGPCRTVTHRDASHFDVSPMLPRA